MEPIQQQADANKFLEGGAFYPTGHIVTAFDDAESAARARQALERAGFPEDHLLAFDAATMARESEENLANMGFLSAGSSEPTRQKQFELAKQGCHFLVIYAPEDADHERALKSLDGIPLRYAVKYRRLIIENLLGEAPTEAPHPEPARVP